VLQLVAVESERSPGIKLSLTLRIHGQLDLVDTAIKLRSILGVVGVDIARHGV
jgi:hypothetical protein